jgi:uncharacterized membrane protein
MNTMVNQNMEMQNEGLPQLPPPPWISGEQNRSASPRRNGFLNATEDPVARGLGWFSMGLGLAQLVAPGLVAQIAGTRGKHTGIIRFAGIREIGHGVSILTQRKPVGGMWSRVAGDAFDLMLLGIALLSPGSHRGRLLFTTMLVGGITALDINTARKLSEKEGMLSEPIPVRRSIVINRPREELYQYWHNFENLPRFMKHLTSVRVYNDGRSHWTAKGLGGKLYEWDARTTDDRPNERIAWISLPGSEVENWGVVEFEPTVDGNGTIVRVHVHYSPPAGLVGATVAKLFGEEPGQQIEGDLRRFKQVMETGEVVLSEGSLWGTGLNDQRPAQPPGNGHNGHKTFQTMAAR